MLWLILLALVLLIGPLRFVLVSMFGLVAKVAAVMLFWVVVIHLFT